MRLIHQRFLLPCLLLLTFLVATLHGQQPEEVQRLTPGGSAPAVVSRTTTKLGIRKIVTTNLYVMEGPKLKSRQLVKGKGDKRPAWSPDGQKIAFRGEFAQLYIVNADGSGRIQLTHRPSVVYDFAWSTVEEKIAYEEVENVHLKTMSGHTVVDSGDQKIVLSNSDGSGREEVMDMRCKLGDEQSLNWAPDGEKIAFTSCTDGEPVVVVMGEHGEGAQAIVKGYDPKWSPDGKRLLFHRGLSIWVANADGTEPRVAIEDEPALCGLAWFPDGKSIAFASERNEKHQTEIFRINVDGTGMEKIASRPHQDLCNPTLSPDGTRLVVNSIDRRYLDNWNYHPLRAELSDDFDIWAIDLGSHKRQRLGSGSYSDVLWEKK